MSNDDQNNRDKYLSLLKKTGISQAKSAELIKEQTNRPCSARTVRSWLAEPSVPSAIPCPDWAVKNLTIALKRNGLID